MTNGKTNSTRIADNSERVFHRLLKKSGGGGVRRNGEREPRKSRPDLSQSVRVTHEIIRFMSCFGKNRQGFNANHGNKLKLSPLLTPCLVINGAIQRRFLTDSGSVVTLPADSVNFQTGSVRCRT